MELRLFRKGSENNFSTTFLYHFSRKIFLILFSINWPNYIVWLPLPLVNSAILIFLERKELLRWNKKRFQSIFKGFQTLESAFKTYPRKIYLFQFKNRLTLLKRCNMCSKLRSGVFIVKFERISQLLLFVLMTLNR